MNRDELRNLSTQEIYSRFSPACYKCGVPLADRDDMHSVVVDGLGKLACSDCYFSDLGELIDQHPVGVPRMRRGGCSDID